MKRILEIKKQESLEFLRAFCEQNKKKFMEAEEGSWEEQESQICLAIASVIINDNEIDIQKAEDTIRKMFGGKFSKKSFDFAIMSIEQYL